MYTASQLHVHLARASVVVCCKPPAVVSCTAVECGMCLTDGQPGRGEVNFPSKREIVGLLSCSACMRRVLRLRFACPMGKCRLSSFVGLMYLQGCSPLVSQEDLQLL